MLPEIEAFEQKYPIGSKQRLALALMLYSACRREDIVRFGSQHIHNGRLQYTQAKNEHRNPVRIDIPVHPDPANVIAATPSTGHLTFLVNEHGIPFSLTNFSKTFRRWCNKAGLPQCSAHGMPILQVVAALLMRSWRSPDVDHYTRWNAIHEQHQKSRWLTLLCPSSNDEQKCPTSTFQKCPTPKKTCNINPFLGCAHSRPEYGHWHGLRTMAMCHSRTLRFCRARALCALHPHGPNGREATYDPMRRKCSLHAVSVERDVGILIGTGPGEIFRDGVGT